MSCLSSGEPEWAGLLCLQERVLLEALRDSLASLHFFSRAVGGNNPFRRRYMAAAV
jgi:hypothetical protein